MIIRCVFAAPPPLRQQRARKNTGIDRLSLVSDLRENLPTVFILFRSTVSRRGPGARNGFMTAASSRTRPGRPACDGVVVDASQEAFVIVVVVVVSSSSEDDGGGGASRR